MILYYKIRKILWYNITTKAHYWILSWTSSFHIMTVIFSKKIIFIWRVSSSGIWRRVVRWVSTHVSEEYIASIFRVVEIGSEFSCHLLARWFAKHISSNFILSSIVTSQTSFQTQRTTRCHIPKDDIFHNHRYENLKSYLYMYVAFTRVEFLRHSENVILLFYPRMLHM
jgi:hypothetical protein